MEIIKQKAIKINSASDTRWIFNRADTIAAASITATQIITIIKAVFADLFLIAFSNSIKSDLHRSRLFTAKMSSFFMLFRSLSLHNDALHAICFTNTMMYGLCQTKRIDQAKQC